MHLTLEKEATKPARSTSCSSRSASTGSRSSTIRSGHARPWALPIPATSITPSVRAYAPPPEPEYPFHDRSVRVTRCGRICLGRRRINLSHAFAGQVVGIREVEDPGWLVSFLDFDPGLFDQGEGRVEPGANPFGTEKVSTMSPE
jgi:putative transposase